MKIKITLTDDEGKVYEREIDLNQTATISKTTPKKMAVKDKKNFSGMAGGIRLLIENRFLNSPKSVKDIFLELNKRGYYGKRDSVDKLLRVDFTNNRILTRIKENKVWLYVIRK